MHQRVLIVLFVFFFLTALTNVLAQKVNEFPKKTDALHVKVELFDQLMRGNHWNEGAIMQHVIFPPAGLDRPIVGTQAVYLDPTSEMLAAYSHKYTLTKDPKDREIANQIIEAVLKLEKVTGVPGLVARSFNQTDQLLWHEGGTQTVIAAEEGTAAAMIRNYWFGRYYGFIDPKW